MLIRIRRFSRSRPGWCRPSTTFYSCSSARPSGQIKQAGRDFGSAVTSAGIRIRPVRRSLFMRAEIAANTAFVAPARPGKAIPRREPQRFDLEFRARSALSHSVSRRGGWVSKTRSARSAGSNPPAPSHSPPPWFVLAKVLRMSTRNRPFTTVRVSANETGDS